MHISRLEPEYPRIQDTLQEVWQGKSYNIALIVDYLIDH